MFRAIVFFGLTTSAFAGAALDVLVNAAASFSATIQQQLEVLQSTVCVLVAVRTPDDQEPIVAEGRWYGHIVTQPRGVNGFGYDPYFWLDELGATAAELPPQRKNSLSHRAQAMRQLRSALADRWSWD